jgi:hypothetical protein
VIGSAAASAMTRSAGFAELNRELGWSEDREVAAKYEQVLVACHEVRATVDRER